MLNRLKSLFSFQTTKKNYDNLFTTKQLYPNSTNGLRSELTKHFSQSLSFTSSFLFLNDKSPNFFQLTTTFNKPNFIFQTT